MYNQATLEDDQIWHNLALGTAHKQQNTDQWVSARKM